MLDVAAATSKLGATLSTVWVAPVKPAAMSLFAVSLIPVPVPFRFSPSVPVPEMPVIETV